MSDRKIRWAPRLEPGDHISGCDYLGLRELDSSSVDTLLQRSIGWSSPCTGHHQSCPVQPALATPAKLLGALRTGNTHEVVLCLAHWQRLRSADVASYRFAHCSPVRWSSLVLATTKVALCLAHWQLLRSADVASYRFAHCSPARWSSLVLATASVAMCQIHWQRLRSADVASTRLRSLLTSTVV